MTNFLMEYLPILIILIYFFLVSISTYLPLLYITRQPSLALKFTIPVSISVITIIGYPFYSFHILKYFSLFSIIFLICINLFFYRLVRDFQQILPIINIKKSVVFFFILLIPVLFTRFYDSFSTLAPGHADTIYHIRYLNDLKIKGVFPVYFYAPGFHILFYPLYLMLSNDLYRFAGPILGLLTVLSLILLFHDKFSKKTLLFMTLLFCSPVLNFLIQQSISFWPTTLSYFLFIALLYLLGFYEDFISSKAPLSLVFIIILCLSITVPYFFVQLCPLLGLVAILSLILKKTFSSSYLKFTLTVFLFSVLGLAFAFIHVILQTNVFNKKGSFPEIPYTIIKDNKTISTTNYETAKVDSPAVQQTVKVTNTKKSFLSNSLDYLTKIQNQYILPALGSLTEIITIKGFRPFTQLSSLKTYLWILLSLAVLPFSVIIKNKHLFILSITGIIFGFIAQTGVLEIGTYRGRISIYFLFLPVLLISYLYHLYQNFIPKTINLLLFIILFLSAFISPPYFFRDYCPEIADISKTIVNQHPGQQLYFITQNYQVSVLSKNIKVLPLSIDSLISSDNKPHTYIILNKKQCNFTPNIFRQASSTDINYLKYLSDQAVNSTELQNIIDSITTSQLFQKYNIIWENPNIIIYGNDPISTPI